LMTMILNTNKELNMKMLEVLSMYCVEKQFGETQKRFRNVDVRTVEKFLYTVRTVAQRVRDICTIYLRTLDRYLTSFKNNPLYTLFIEMISIFCTDLASH
jgi:hypothetical protein